MRVDFLGGVGTVTGSATLLEREGLKWLVDCGMVQGENQKEERNRSLQSYDPKHLSFVLLTHAHIDHSGLIPKIVKEGFTGKVICTKATLDLCEIMLRDSGHIQETEAEWQNRKSQRSGREGPEPLYTVKDAEESLRYFEPIRYDEIVALDGRVKVRFRDAGHILGSAIIEIWVEEQGKERKLVFSGDLGHSDQPIVRNPTGIEEGDVVWLESTYGDRVHRGWEETLQEFLKIIQDAIGEQSKVVIPAFAVERTQVIIYTLGQFIRKGLIPSIPIYIDSPLAISATEIFKKNPECFDQETLEILFRGDNPLELPEIIYARTTEESKAINEDSRPGIIISASGMCDSGRIKHHLKHHLWQPKSHIVIIGYQAEGTLGRKIVEGAQTVRIFGEEIAVQAQIHTLGGFSAHADQRGLLDWLSHFKNPNLEVFIVHGEEKVASALGQRIRERFHFKTMVPQWKERRFLWGPEEEGLPEEAAPEKKREEFVYPLETLPGLARDLDRSYKRLRRKLRAGRWTGRISPEPWRLKTLKEIQAKIDELESGLK